MAPPGAAQAAVLPAPLPSNDINELTARPTSLPAPPLGGRDWLQPPSGAQGPVATPPASAIDPATLTPASFGNMDKAGLESMLVHINDISEEAYEAMIARFIELER